MAKKDAEFIMYQQKNRQQLYQNFDEYIKERLKIEREAAKSQGSVKVAEIHLQKDVENRLCYIEQFIDIVSFIF
jgi:hypothetical protein